MSVGIIGGANGPTAIYVASNTFLGSVGHWILLAGVLLITIILWVLKIKMKK